MSAPQDTEIETTRVYYHMLARCETCGAAWCPTLGAETDVLALAAAHVAQTGHRVTLETRSFICSASDPISAAAAKAPVDAERAAAAGRLVKALMITNGTYGQAIELIDRWDRQVEDEPDLPVEPSK